MLSFFFFPKFPRIFPYVQKESTQNSGLTRKIVGLCINFHQPKEKELDINYSPKLYPELFDFSIE